jgi:hypothetical protein
MPGRRLYRTLCAGLLAGVAAAPAAAQQSGGPLLQSDIPFDLGRGPAPSVLERERPQFEAVGLSAGGFQILPRLDLGIGFLDNVYSASVDPRGDAYVQTNVSALARSRWSRHALIASASVQAQRYLTYGQENQTGWDASVSGRYDLGRDTQADGAASIRRSFEARFAENFPDSAAAPVPFTESNARLGASTRTGDLRLTTVGSLGRIDYGDVPSLSGGTVDQDFRDRSLSRVTGRAEYLIGGRNGVFVQPSYTRIRYDQTGDVTDRSARDWRFLAGMTVDVTPLIRATVGAGYVQRKFDRPELRDLSGFAADLRVQYLLTGLTTLSLTGRRYVEDSAIPGSGGYFNTGLRVGVDHELRRWVLLSLFYEAEHDDYDGSDRLDRIGSLQAGARYLANQRVEFNLVARRSTRSSSGAAGGRDILETRLLLSATLKR